MRDERPVEHAKPGHDGVGYRGNVINSLKPAQVGRQHAGTGAIATVRDGVALDEIDEHLVGSCVRHCPAQRERVASPHPDDVDIAEPPGRVWVAQVDHRGIKTQRAKVSKVAQDAGIAQHGRQPVKSVGNQRGSPAGPEAQKPTGMCPEPVGRQVQAHALRITRPNGGVVARELSLTLGDPAVRIIAVEPDVTDQVPVLWITGPAGVGKSTVSWQIFSELAQAGVHVAFADADQFCMCFPAPPGDPARERIKAQNVGLLIPRYRAAGADCVIVNGCLDPAIGVRPELMPQAGTTVCRLRASPDDIVRRFTGRHGPGEDLDELLAETLAEADAMDASDFADVCVDTTGASAAEVVALVRRRCRDWPGLSGSLRPARVPPASGAGDGAGPERSGGADDVDGTVLLLCGPTGVGKSTIGFELFVRYVGGGLTASYVDLDQIGFVRPGSDEDRGGHRLKAGNLSAMWRTYQAAGATHLIATGPVESEAAVQTYIRALPGARVTVCRLHAGPADLTRRIVSRGEGGSWAQPGDPLCGQSAEYLRSVAEQATADANALERTGVGTFRIVTDGRTVAESADLIVAMSNPGDGT